LKDLTYFTISLGLAQFTCLIRPVHVRREVRNALQRNALIMDSSPPEILIDEGTPKGHSKRRRGNERAKTYSPPSSPLETPRHFSPRQQNVPSNVSSLAISVEDAERSLAELIDDFEHGKLQAFGKDHISEKHL